MQQSLSLSFIRMWVKIFCFEEDQKNVFWEVLCCNNRCCNALRNATGVATLCTSCNDICCCIPFFRELVLGHSVMQCVRSPTPIICSGALSWNARNLQMWEHKRWDNSYDNNFTFLSHNLFPPLPLRSRCFIRARMIFASPYCSVFGCTSIFLMNHVIEVRTCYTHFSKGVIVFTERSSSSWLVTQN